MLDAKTVRKSSYYTTPHFNTGDCTIFNWRLHGHSQLSHALPGIIGCNRGGGVRHLQAHASLGHANMWPKKKMESSSSRSVTTNTSSSGEVAVT